MVHCYICGLSLGDMRYNQNKLSSSIVRMRRKTRQRHGFRGKYVYAHKSCRNKE